MINFIVYHYSFPKAEQEDLLSSLYKTEETLNNELIDKLYEASQSDEKHLNLQFEYTTGSKKELIVVKHSNTIYAQSKGVFLLQIHIEKNKLVTPEDSTEKTPVKDYPWCWMLIDTRPDSHLILVQKKNEAFGKNTDYVADYLFGDYCERELDLLMNGTQLYLEKRICDGTLWEFVKHRTHGGRDFMKSLFIKITDKGDTSETHSNDVDRAFQFILHAMKMPEGDIKLYSSTENRPILEDKIPDCIGIAEQLIRNHYTIRADFEKSGSFECGKNTDAIYGVENGIVENFCISPISNKDGTDPLALILWINDFIQHDTSYHYSDKLSNYGRHKRKEKKRA